MISSVADEFRLEMSRKDCVAVVLLAGDVTEAAKETPPDFSYGYLAIVHLHWWCTYSRAHNYTLRI